MFKPSMKIKLGSYSNSGMKLDLRSHDSLSSERRLKSKDDLDIKRMAKYESLPLNLSGWLKIVNETPSLAYTKPLYLSSPPLDKSTQTPTNTHIYGLQAKLRTLLYMITTLP